MRIVVALFCACIAVPSEAATFYYVGGPYIVSNYDVPEPPVVTTGVLEIDETKLPQGQGLANLSFNYSHAIGDGPPEYVTRLEFRNSARLLSMETQWAPFKFDSAGRVDTWEWQPFESGFVSAGANGRGGDSLIRPMTVPGMSDDDDATELGRKFLRQRGYRDGTPEFDKLLATHIWMDGHRTGANSGIWFTDLFEATSAVERATRMASRRPPSNIYSIANSCPVPKS